MYVQSSLTDRVVILRFKKMQFLPSGLGKKFHEIVLPYII